MNQSAEKHLTKAADYLARGDEFYRKAKPEIHAAVEAGASQREVGRFLLRSPRWVRDVLAWNGEGTLYEGDTERRATDMAKQVLREKPEIVADLTPAEQRQVDKALDTASAKREHERKQAAKAKEREHLGDETVDDLELRENLQSTEYLLIKARGELRGFVKNAGEIGVENAPESWRDSCLDWIADLEGHLGMAKALLKGGDIDWTAFDDMLQKEGA